MSRELAATPRRPWRVAAPLRAALSLLLSASALALPPGGPPIPKGPFPPIPGPGPIVAYPYTPDDALRVSGHVTCDNYFQLYTGTCEGSTMALTYRGGSCDWTKPVTFGFNTTDKFLYIVCWSDHTQAQGLLHDLTINNEFVPSGSAGWQVCATNVAANRCNGPPPVGTIQSQIQAATWTTPTVGGANGVAPWGFRAPISGLAKWTWYESGNDNSSAGHPFTGGFDHGEFLIFRAPLNVVRHHFTGIAVADNFYGLYTIDQETNSGVLHYYGGSTFPAVLGFDYVTKDRYLYIVAWSDDATAQGLLHDITVNGVPIPSGSPQWRVCPNSQNLDTATGPSALAVRNSIVAHANGTGCFATAVGPANGSASGFPWFLPWGTMPIYTPCNWIWYDSHNQVSATAPFAPGFNHGEFLLFRIDMMGCDNVVAATAPPLRGDAARISVAQGGTDTFTIDAGASHAGANYLLLGSLSGTVPGIAAGNLLLPLNPDPYFTLSLGGLTGGPFHGFVGTLDAAGSATAQLILPPNGLPSLAGITLHHAFVLPDAGFASNPVRLDLDP